MRVFSVRRPLTTTSTLQRERGKARAALQAEFDESRKNIVQPRWKLSD